MVYLIWFTFNCFIDYFCWLFLYIPRKTDDLIYKENQVSTPGVWSGTTISTSGYIQNIYLNTDLNVDDVVTICDSLNFVYFELANVLIWSCFTDSTMANGLTITKFPNSDGNLYLINHTKDNVNTLLFTNFVDDSSMLLGWQAGFNGIIEFNIENQLSLVAPSLNFTPENEKANLLFSSTPFEYINGVSYIEKHYFVFEEYEDIRYYDKKEKVYGNYLDKLVINPLNDNTLNQFLSSFDLSSFESYCFFSCENFNLFVFAIGSTDVYYSLIYSIDNTIELSEDIILYCPIELYEEFTIYNSSVPIGWAEDLSFDVYSSSYTYDSIMTDYDNIFSDYYHDYYKRELVKKSIFDLSLDHTLNTFDKFTLPFIDNAFTSIFDLFGFSSNNVSNYFSVVLTWFLQFMLIHVVVDFLGSIFKIYHKLMEKVGL